MHLRASKKLRAEVSLYDPVGVDKEGNQIVLLDVLGTEESLVSDAVESACEWEQVLEKWKKLGLREKKVLAWRYGIFNGIEQTQREIAKKMGISRSYVSRIEK